MYQCTEGFCTARSLGGRGGGRRNSVTSRTCCALHGAVLLKNMSCPKLARVGSRFVGLEVLCWRNLGMLLQLAIVALRFSTCRVKVEGLIISC